MNHPFTGSLIGALRRAPWLTRPMALTVVLALLSLVGMPTVVAARAAERQAEIRESLEPSSVPQELSRQLIETRRQLQSLRQQQRGDAPTAATAATEATASLRAIRERLAELRQQMLERFDAVADRLEAGDVSPAIHERHRQARERFLRQMDDLIDNLERVEQGSGADREQALENSLQALQKHRVGKSQQPFDPERLPARGLRKEAGEHKPMTREEQFDGAGLHDRPRPTLASHGTFRLDELAGAADPAWRAESPEITLTQPIIDKAAELDHDPVAIHQWVRNNVQWIPAWGAMQSAEHTLSSRRGNAMDIAGLEIALLRASDIPARYVHGTVEVDEARFRNWAGGYDDILAATDYAASGGIPIQAIVEAGRIARVQMEHVWVEAAVDYFPSRAGVNQSADSWIPLDPSFKQYEFLEGIDVAAVTGTDPQVLAQSFLDSGTVNEAEGYVAGFDPSILQNAQNDAESALEDYITNELPDDATVADVLGGRRIIPQDYTTLPASIPNRLTVVGARYDELPNELRNRLSLAFGTDLFGQPRNPVRFPWAAVNGQRLTLSFSSATPKDEEALLALLPEGEITDPSQLPSSIPSHLVEVVPEIRLNGEVVHTGARMQLGEEIDFNFTVDQLGFGTDTAVSPIPAGAFVAIAVAGGSVAPQRLENLQQQVQATREKLESGDDTQLASLTREDLLGDLFHAGTLAYFGQFDALATLQARQQGAQRNLGASAGTYGYHPETTYLFGLPHAIEPGGINMDLDRIAWTNGLEDPTPEKRRQLNVQLGALSSGLEHGVPEQMFSTPEQPAEAVSAVKALSIANQQGQRIYRITQANQAEVLPKINHNPDTMDEIRAAVAAGKEATTHTDPIAVPGWEGAGYVILDPEVGDGAWRIGGGANGGFVDDGTRGEPDSDGGSGLLLLSVIQDIFEQLANTLQAVDLKTVTTATGRLLSAVSALINLMIVWDETQSPILALVAGVITVLLGLLITPIAIAIAAKLGALIGAVGAAVAAALFSIIVTSFITMYLLNTLFGISLVKVSRSGRYQTA